MVVACEVAGREFEIVEMLLMPRTGDATTVPMQSGLVPGELAQDTIVAQKRKEAVGCICCHAELEGVEVSVQVTWGVAIDS